MISSMCTFTSNRRGPASIDANMNQESSKISDWLIVNKHSLNIWKTKFQFHYEQKIMNVDNYPKLKINDSEIERVLEFNFLGLTINENLDWSSHCNKIAYKTSRTLGIMNRLKHELPSAILKLMYDALIMSHFQYFIFLLSFVQTSGTSNTNCYLSKCNAHTDALFKSNKLLKIEDIFEIQCSKLYYRYRNVILPKYLLDMFIENGDVHSHNTRQSSYLHHGVTRTISARNCVRYSLPVLIDRTSNNVLQSSTSHSIDDFAFLAKSYALERYENGCNIRYILLIVAHRLIEDNSMSLYPFLLPLRWLPCKRLFLNLNGSLLTCLIHKENEHNQKVLYYLCHTIRWKPVLYMMLFPLYSFLYFVE